MYIYIYTRVYTNELSWFPQSLLKARSFGERNRSLGHQLADLGLAQIVHGTHLPGATHRAGKIQICRLRENPQETLAAFWPLKNIGLFL